jgi:hypothetical protein
MSDLSASITDVTLPQNILSMNSTSGLYFWGRTGLRQVGQLVNCHTICMADPSKDVNNIEQSKHHTCTDRIYPASSVSTVPKLLLFTDIYISGILFIWIVFFLYGM